MLNDRKGWEGKKKEKCASRLCVDLKIVRPKERGKGGGAFLPYLQKKKKISQIDFHLLPPPTS